MKLSSLYSTAPFKKMGLDPLQFGKVSKKSNFQIQQRKPYFRGRSILGFKQPKIES